MRGLCGDNAYRAQSGFVALVWIHIGFRAPNKLRSSTQFLSDFLFLFPTKSVKNAFSHMSNYK